MNDEKAIKFITSRLEQHCDAVTTNMVTTLIKKLRDEVSQKDDQISNCQSECRQLKMNSKRKYGNWQWK